MCTTYIYIYIYIDICIYIYIYIYLTMLYTYMIPWIWRVCKIGHQISILRVLSFMFHQSCCFTAATSWSCMDFLCVKIEGPWGLLILNMLRVMKFSHCNTTSMLVTTSNQTLNFARFSHLQKDNHLYWIWLCDCLLVGLRLPPLDLTGLLSLLDHKFPYKSLIFPFLNTQLYRCRKYQKILKYIILVSHFPTLANGMKFGSQPRLECLNIFVMLTEEKGPGGFYWTARCFLGQNPTTMWFRKMIRTSKWTVMRESLSASIDKNLEDALIGI